MSTGRRARGATEGRDTPVVALAPDNWVPGGAPDPLIRDQHDHVGEPVSRIDGPLKVSGSARFAAEFSMERMVYAAITYSTIAKGRLAEIDTAAAESAPGVVAVMTYRNAPRLKPPPLILSDIRAGGLDTLPVMQDDRIHWNGQPIAVVLAETQEQADHATSLIRATYETEAALTDFEQARARRTESVVLMGQPMHIEVGDAETMLAEAEVKIEETYSTPGHNHNAIELHAVTAAWQDGGVLRVHDASQLVAHAAWSLAQMFGIAENQVVVTSPFVGGGFGGKNFWQHQALASAAAELVGRPVRLVVSREGVYRIIGGRSPTVQRVALGADRDGKLKALIHDGVSPRTVSNLGPEVFTLSSFSAYATESMLSDLQAVNLDMLSNSMMRAPGEAVGSFALESAMDELAHATGIDPIDLRVRNEPEMDPLSSLPFSSRNIVEAWRLGADRFGWSRRNPAPRAVRDGEWLVGMGCAMASLAYDRQPGGAARITLTADGRAIVDIAAHEMGMGTATVQTQVCAARLGLSMEAVTFNYGDSTLPGVVIAGGSQQTAAIAGSVIAAQRALVKELVELVDKESALAGLSPDEIGCRDGGLCKLDDPQRHETYASILARANRARVSAAAEAPEPAEQQHWSMRSFGAMFCEVRVNVLTGEPRVARFLACFDCGRILNAKTAGSQFRGGIIMGLGLALMEETLLDGRNGRIMNANLADYHMPTHLDVPEIDVMWTDIPDLHTPMGAHGIGEIGVTGVGAAVANAIFNATGTRVRDLPITLDKLL
jgi:xanthine dehydrogenase YagR molybdenum-binding subunit